MPFMNVHVGKPLCGEKKAELAASIAQIMPTLPGKTQDNTMIEISAGREMFMGGEQRELVFVDMRVFQASPLEAKEAFVEKLSAVFENVLGIPSARQYINIIEMPEWGSRGKLNH